MRPYFSVVIPVYNGVSVGDDENLLLRCLDSIDRAIARLPSECAVEVICVDDGSADSSGEFLDRYASNHPWCKILHRENAGICLATNAGIDTSVGDWLSFVDQDDLVEEDYFSAFVQKPNKADVNFFAHSRLLSSGGLVCNRLPEEMYLTGRDEMAECVKSLVYNKTKENLFGYSWNKFVSRELIEKNHIRLPKLYRFMEYQDEIFAFEMCHCARSISYFPKSLYVYRIGENNHSSGRVPDHVNRARLETEIGDKDDRFAFKSAAYMSAGMALLMRAYESICPSVAMATARYLVEHRQYMLPVVIPENHLAKLASWPLWLLFVRLWSHGCCAAVKRYVLRINR